MKERFRAISAGRLVGVFGEPRPDGAHGGAAFRQRPHRDQLAADRGVGVAGLGGIGDAHLAAFDEAEAGRALDVDVEGIDRIGDIGDLEPLPAERAALLRSRRGRNRGRVRRRSSGRSGSRARCPAEDCPGRSRRGRRAARRAGCGTRPRADASRQRWARSSRCRRPARHAAGPRGGRNSPRRRPVRRPRQRPPAGHRRGGWRRRARRGSRPIRRRLGGCSASDGGAAAKGGERCRVIVVGPAGDVGEGDRDQVEARSGAALHGRAGRARG